MSKPEMVANLRSAIDEAVSASVQAVKLPGIDGADVRTVNMTSEQLHRAAAQLEQGHHSEPIVAAEVELFLRISNTDVLRSIEPTEFRVAVEAHGNELRAAAITDKDWAKAWERGIEPIRQRALQAMKEDVWNLDANLAEDSHTFQAAMVLHASEFVGPYADRIATFLGYPPGLVQVIAARLYEARIWEDDQVRSEPWFDPQKGGIAFLLDVLVAQGELIRGWSEEKKQFAYSAPDNRAGSQLAV